VRIFCSKRHAILTLIVLVLLLLSGCTDEKDKKIAELNKKVEELAKLREEQVKQKEHL
jgi:outer membrane murein-binding lipoprotein Lpp